MTDHNERACRYCGSLLHHEDWHAGEPCAVEHVRAAFLAMAEECERRAAEIDEGQGRVMPVEAAQPLESLAAWARGGGAMSSLSWWCMGCGRERTGQAVESDCPTCARAIDCPTCEGTGSVLPEEVPARGSAARYRRAVEARVAEWGGPAIGCPCVGVYFDEDGMVTRVVYDDVLRRPYDTSRLPHNVPEGEWLARRTRAARRARAILERLEVKR